MNREQQRSEESFADSIIHDTSTHGILATDYNFNEGLVRDLSLADSAYFCSVTTILEVLSSILVAICLSLVFLTITYVGLQETYV